MKKDELKKIDVSEDSLELLLKDLFLELSDDMVESQENVNFFSKKVKDEDFGPQAFGIMLNEALRTKGMVRDRQIKAISLIKDRVKDKRSSGNGNVVFDADFISSLAEQVKGGK